MALDLQDTYKKALCLGSFLRGQLIHTNLQLHYACNFQCQICDFWKEAYRDRPRLSAAQVGVISRKLAEIGPQVVSIGGGEPLLHPEIVEVVRALSAHHFPVMICNGWFVTEKNARALFEAGIHEVSVSVDYADPARHDRQRGMDGAFDRALRALEILQQSRVHPRQRVHMIAVVLDDNLDDLAPLIERCRKMGITFLVTLYSRGRGDRPPRAIPRNVSAHLLNLHRQYPEFVALRGYLKSFSRAISEGGIGPCDAGKYLCNIGSDGAVGLCIDHLDRPVGNILTDDMSVLARRLRLQHRRNTCRACWTSCRGNIETLAHGGERLPNLWDYYRLSRGVDLNQPQA